MLSGLDSPSSYLTSMYSRPGEFADGISRVFAVSENGISILAVVFVVCFILYMINHDKD